MDPPIEDDHIGQCDFNSDSDEPALTDIFTAEHPQLRRYLLYALIAIVIFMAAVVAGQL